jgi:hypothetical protein
VVKNQKTTKEYYTILEIYFCFKYSKAIKYCSNRFKKKEIEVESNQKNRSTSFKSYIDDCLKKKHS